VKERINECEVINLTTRYRLDRYLSERFTYFSRSSWQKKIKSDLVTVNGLKVNNPSLKIKNGDTIEFKGIGNDEPEIDRNYNILFEDDYIIAVEKSGDMPIHPAGVYFNNTLTEILKEDFNHEFFPVHRLDRETSGLVLLTKNPQEANKISSNWAEVKKEYIALVHGSFSKSVECTVPIGEAYSHEQLTPHVVHKKRKAFNEASESAHTDFAPITSTDHYSLVSCRLHTGRTHQIRVHLNYLGYSIVGDKIYGKDERYYIYFIENGMTDELFGQLEMKRCALHSYKLVFTHPVNNKTIELKSPLPKDIVDFMKSKSIQL
jgi:RluA family pseudouridine synthase